MARDDDGRAHRHDVLHASHPRGNEQRERRFEARMRGAERASPKMVTGDGADVLGAFFAGGERAAEEQVPECVRSKPWVGFYPAA